MGRALSVLDAFADGSDSLRLTAIARRTDLPMPTALRLVRELVSWGGLERQADGSYRVGTRLWVLGGHAPCPRRLAEVGRPYLRGLRATTGLAVLLTALDGAGARVVEAAGAPTRPGAGLPLHATAAGKALLAYAPAARRRQVLGELTRITPYTITAPGLLDRQLAAIRGGALATATQEWRLGEVELAAPVGPVRAAGPTAALTVIASSTDAVRRAAARLTATAAALGARLDPGGAGGQLSPGG